MTSYSRDVRVRQTRAELDRLIETLRDWEQCRRDRDRYSKNEYRGQYQSQVAAIVGEVRGAAKVIGDLLDTEAAGAMATPLPALFQNCARHDRRIIWLWRAFNYYREKFDQRDDARIGPALRAADEVLWSSMKPFFTGSGITMPPIPLPFINDAYSPIAVRANEAGHLEKEAAIDSGPLKDFFTRLPVALLQLPPMVVTAPWAHVLIAHETGHFIQSLIPAPDGYRSVFRDRVKDAVRTAGGSEQDAAVWARWSPEIFADLYSVAVMGPWAVWTMAQFEFSQEGRLTTRRDDYPSPLVRITLLKNFAEAVGFAQMPRLLDGFGLDLTAEAKASEQCQSDVVAAHEVARLILDPLPGIGKTLPDIVGLRTADFQPAAGMDVAGVVVRWADSLLGRTVRQAERNLRAARQVSAATAQAWKEITEMPAGIARDGAIQTVTKSAFPCMVACSEPGTRAAPPPAREAGALTRIVLEMPDDELFG